MIASISRRVHERGRKIVTQRTMMSTGEKESTDIVGALHEFHDVGFVRGWADRFKPTPERMELFDLILGEITGLGLDRPHVVELGIGPGYLARHILERAPRLSYEGLDFSDAMFGIARENLVGHTDLLTLTKADLLTQDWPHSLSRRPDAIVSTWALHDLFTPEAVGAVYQRCFETLEPGGVLVNGDFIKPDGTVLAFEGGRFEVGKHLDLLRQAGFTDPNCARLFEIEVIAPTSAQNYACLVAHR